MHRPIAQWLRLMATLLALSMLTVTSSAQQSSPSVSDVQRQQVEQIIRDYLLKNPQLIVEVLQRLEAQQQADREQAFKTSLASVRSELFANPAAPSMGNPEGKTIIVEFSDYNCPYCKRMAPTVKDALTKNSDLKVVMIEYPILGPGSHYAAKAALAAKYQNKYREAHLGLFAHKGSLNAGAVDRVMTKVGLDMERLKRDMDRPEIEAALRRNLQIGQTLGIQGTPAFIAGEEVRPGAISASEFAKLVKVASPNE